ncbi:hypothetical protein K523DRAFT_138972 [Schizophyllum commune Tattone D]|nr:hypothetical protein K523DRAFT_138972 [Schizophyllum commune Tattone D]
MLRRRGAPGEGHRRRAPLARSRSVVECSDMEGGQVITPVGRATDVCGTARWASSTESFLPSSSARFVRPAPSSHLAAPSSSSGSFIVRATLQALRPPRALLCLPCAVLHSRGRSRRGHHPCLLVRPGLGWIRGQSCCCARRRGTWTSAVALARTQAVCGPLMSVREGEERSQRQRRWEASESWKLEFVGLANDGMKLYHAPIYAQEA